MLVNAWKFWTLHRNRQEAKRRRKLSAKPARRQLSLETLENRLTPASAGFLTTAPGVIGGNVFVDTNNNGIQDAIEQVVPGVTITLSGTTGQGKTVNVSTATDANGHYNFFGVAPGTYNLTRGLVANFFDGQTVAGNLGGTVASNAISSISVAEGQAGANYNFAVRGLATGQVSLRDFLSTFTNSSTFQPAGAGTTTADGSVEPSGTATPGNSLLDGTVQSTSGAALLGVQVTLSGIDNTGRSVTQSTATNASGFYAFAALQAGTYNVNVTSLPSGFRAGQPTVGSVGGQVFMNNQIVDITLAAGATGANYNFTEIPVPAANPSGGVAISAALADDTAGPGGTTSDSITSDPSIQGAIASNSPIASFRASLDSASPGSFNVLGSLSTSKTFFLNQALLNQIAGGTLSAGAHTLHLQATDSQGHTGTFDIAFVLQNTAPAVPTLHLDSTADPGGTGTTTQSVVTLQGTTSPNVQVALIRNGSVLATTTSQSTGNFSFANISLTAGANQYTVQATDNAGNTSQLQTFVVKETGVVAVPTGPVSETITNSSSNDKFVDLSSQTLFTDAAFSNSIIQFNTSAGPVNVQLTDSVTPQTVANFFDYINSGSYNNDIFHRLARTQTGGLFVLQGGGFNFQPGNTSSLAPLNSVTTGPNVPNEFDASRPNVLGTIAMAKQGGDPNSANSQFFFNLADNTNILNQNQNGGFTVFGSVLSGADMRVINTLASVKTTDEGQLQANPAGSDNGPFANIPLINYTGTNFPKDTTAGNYEMINSVKALQQTEQLTFSVVSNSSASVATASISFGQLDIHPLSQGTTTIVVKATDKGGQSAQVTFNVSVGPVIVTNPGNQTNLDGDTVSLQVNAKDTNGATLTYSASSLPTGLSINPTSGLISGTIANTAHSNSPFTTTVTANDGSSSASQTFTWTVNPVVTVTNPGNQTNKVGDNVNLQIQASDAKGGTLTYAASNLPGGLTINASTGLISGTVAAGAIVGSPFTVNVAATDGTFNGNQTFSWTINP